MTAAAPVLPAPAPVQGVVAGRACAPQRTLRVVSPVGTASVHETARIRAQPTPVRCGPGWFDNRLGGR